METTGRFYVEYCPHCNGRFIQDGTRTTCPFCGKLLVAYSRNLFYEQLQEQSKPVMTPAEFAEKMQAIRDEYIDRKDDEELFHGYADDLICDLLKQLGYGEGVKIFEESPKWYS